MGQDLPQYADLSHFLLNICSTITREDISEITVSINDDPQTIIWGENVEFKTKENPDPPTECIGLKFVFPLNKEEISSEDKRKGIWIDSRSFHNK